MSELLVTRERPKAPLRTFPRPQVRSSALQAACGGHARDEPIPNNFPSVATRATQHHAADEGEAECEEGEGRGLGDDEGDLVAAVAVIDGVAVENEPRPVS